MTPSLTAALALVSSFTITASRSAPPPSSMLDDGTSTVGIQMFGWNWDSVAEECRKFIGPAGYGYVQLSPPQEHISGMEWWTDYQPVSYQLISKRGNRAQFKQMVDECHAAGVAVVVDTIWNHMAGLDSGTGIAGSTFTHYNYPGLWQYDDFHHCGLEPHDNIANFSNRVEVQTCQLVGLADLATNASNVQQRIADFGNDVLSLGVDGLRIDSAKHIDVTELKTMLELLTRRVYVSQEVVYGDAYENILPDEYLVNGEVQEFRYTTALMNAFAQGNLTSLLDLDNKGWVPGNRSNVFVANHDTERRAGSLNITSPSNTYILAHIFMLGHTYGRPVVLSSYNFSTPDDGAPNGGAGACSGNQGSGNWACQHRLTPIANMVNFRNNVGSAPLASIVSPQADRIAFERGSLGFVAINNGDTPWNASFNTSLKDLTYCNVIRGSPTGGSCSGESVILSGGSFTATIGARDALAIHSGADTTSPPLVKKAGKTSGSLARHGRIKGRHLLTCISLGHILYQLASY